MGIVFAALVYFTPSFREENGEYPYVYVSDRGYHTNYLPLTVHRLDRRLLSAAGETANCEI